LQRKYGGIIQGSGDIHSPNPGRCESYASAAGVPVTNDGAELLKRPDVDAFCIQLNT
jgi:predicted dehydrogenase